jgi:uncharacterized protein YoxC
MTDIVERIRALLGDTNEEQDTINEAADEIERLREALREIERMANRRSGHAFDGDADYFRIARAALGEDK